MRMRVTLSLEEVADVLNQIVEIEVINPTPTEIDLSGLFSESNEPTYSVKFTGKTIGGGAAS